MKGKFFCPRCKSFNVRKDLTASLAFGAPQNWICNNCGYLNIIFPVMEKIKLKIKKK